MPARTRRFVQILQLSLFVRLEALERIDSLELLHRLFDLARFSQSFDLFCPALNGQLNLANLPHLQSKLLAALLT